MTVDGGARIGHEYRITWAMRPFDYGASPARWAEAVHVSIEQAQGQLNGLRAMEAPADCAARLGTGHCDIHVWDIRMESRSTGPWEQHWQRAYKSSSATTASVAEPEPEPWSGPGPWLPPESGRSDG